MNPMKINLLEFCDPEGEVLRAPFALGERVYASDGRIVISVPREEFQGVESVGRANRFATAVEAMIADILLSPGEWRELPAIVGKSSPCNCYHGMVPEVAVCESCGGTGRLSSCPLCFKSHECACCDGRGTVETDNLVVCRDCWGTEERPPNQRLNGHTLRGAYYLHVLRLGHGVEYYHEEDAGGQSKVLFGVPGKGVLGLLMVIENGGVME